MSTENEEIFVPVPLHVVQKEARYSRTMKQILGKFAKENNLPGSSKIFEVSTDHNKVFELEEKKKEAAKLEAEIQKSENLTVPEQLKAAKEKAEESQKVKDANNKRRS